MRKIINLQLSYNLAINSDSAYALAYAGLADINFCLARYNKNALENYNKAWEMANKALQLDKNLPEAYAVIGLVD